MQLGVQKHYIHIIFKYNLYIYIYIYIYLQVCICFKVEYVKWYLEAFASELLKCFPQVHVED